MIKETFAQNGAEALPRWYRAIVVIGFEGLGIGQRVNVRKSRIPDMVIVFTGASTRRISTADARKHLILGSLSPSNQQIEDNFQYSLST